MVESPCILGPWGPLVFAFGFAFAFDFAFAFAFAFAFVLGIPVVFNCRMNDTFIVFSECVANAI